MKYKFPQFKVEIENATTVINLNSIQDKAIDKLLSVDVTLKTDSASFGVRAVDMPYKDSWDDHEIESMVNNWLKQFEA